MLHVFTQTYNFSTKEYHDLGLLPVFDFAVPKSKTWHNAQTEFTGAIRTVRLDITPSALLRTLYDNVPVTQSTGPLPAADQESAVPFRYVSGHWAIMSVRVQICLRNKVADNIRRNK